MSGVAVAPPTVTAVALERFVPVIVMDDPRSPEVGLTFEIAGAETYVNPPAAVVLPAPFVSCTTWFAPEPAGTVTVTEVDPAVGTGFGVTVVPPIEITGCDVRAGIALVGTKFVPVMVSVSPALPLLGLEVMAGAFP